MYSSLAAIHQLFSFLISSSFVRDCTRPVIGVRVQKGPALSRAAERVPFSRREGKRREGKGSDGDRTEEKERGGEAEGIGHRAWQRREVVMEEPFVNE